MNLCRDVDADLVRAHFGARVAERGRVYARDGRVSDLEDVGGDGHAFGADVAGTQPDPYQVTVVITHLKRNVVTIDSQCSCPVEDSCKHAAALLFAVLAKRGADEDDDDDVAVVPLRRDPEVERWLGALRPAPAPPAAKPECVAYALRSKHAHELDVAIGFTRRKVDGTLSRPRSVSIPAAAISTAREMTPDDAVIARLLAGAASSSDARVRGRLRADALAMLLPSGRAFWEQPRTALRPGAARAGAIDWQLHDDGTQSPRVVVDGVPCPFFVARDVWYVDLVSGEVGVVDLGVDPADAATILRAPTLRAADAADAAAHLARFGITPPRTNITERIVDDLPVAVLRLERAALRPEYARYRYESPVTHPVARLRLRYGTFEVHPHEGPREVRLSLGEDIRVFRRSRAAEDAAVAELTTRGMMRFGGWIATAIQADAAMFAFPENADSEVWADFILRDVPLLRASGWQITIADDFPVRVVLPDAPWDLDLAERALGTFDVDISVDVDGKTVPLVPIILAALRRSPKLLERDGAVVVGALADGRRLALPADRLRSVVATLIELFDAPRGDEHRIGLARALALEDIDGALRLRGSGVDRLRAAARVLHGADAAPVAIPAGLRAELRPYQHDGLNWLQRLREHGFGGILADSMGLGKTLQTIAHILAEKEAGRLDRPVLVVAPTSVLPNWRAETERFAPSLRVLVLHGPDRAENHADMASADLVITSYALLARDAHVLLAQPWHIAVLDEAQNVKNPAAKVSQTAYRLEARQRVALTGTPIENHLGELWSLFAYVDPSILGERTRFNRAFRSPIEKNDDAVRRRALAARIAPFVLRRTKELVARELPAKSEIVRTIELGTAQRDLYETIRAAMHERVRKAIAKQGLAKSQIVVLDALLKLRQVCCDPRLVKSDRAHAVGPGAKLTALVDMLEELVDDGRRILLFSQFTSMLALIEEALQDKAIPYAFLTGKTRDRETPVRRFQAGELPLFLISLKAGGTGLNLTAADTVIHYDPWWNPAVERQATDRAHRIGQAKPVFVYKLVCERTIEERIVELQARKGALADALLDGSAGAATLDADEIAHLFE